ncbi:Hypothetical protein ABZS17H1_04042 [Kosakonia cowanii]
MNDRDFVIIFFIIIMRNAESGLYDDNLSCLYQMFRYK